MDVKGLSAVSVGQRVVVGATLIAGIALTLLYWFAPDLGNFVPDTFNHAYSALVMIGIAAAFGIYAIQWRAKPIRNLMTPRSQILGAGFLSIAVLQFIHLLGITDVAKPWVSFAMSMVCWHASFLLTPVVLLLAVFVPRVFNGRRLNRWGVRFAGAVTSISVLLALLLKDLPPASFFPTVHLTRIIAGTGTILAFVALLGCLRVSRRERRVERTMLLSATVLIVLQSLVTLTSHWDSSPFALLEFTSPALRTAALLLILDGYFMAAILRPHTELEQLKEHIEKELQQKLALLEAIFDAVPEGLMVFDGERRVLQRNHGAVQILVRASHDAEAALDLRDEFGNPLDPLSTPEVQGRAGNHLAQLVSPHDPNEVRWIDYSLAPVIQKDGSRMGRVLSLRDVTQTRWLQHQRETLLQGVSHDLKSPLSAIQLAAQRLGRMLAKDPEHVTSVKCADSIVRGVHQMQGIMQDLVDAQQNECRLHLVIEALSLPEWVAGLLARFEGVPQCDRIQVRLEPTLPPLPADPRRLERVLINLLSNALKYSDSGPVTLEVSVAGDEVVFGVRDCGVGIAPADHHKVFQPFFRAAATKGREGTGMGLHVSRLLVESHGGRIWFDSRPGETTFRVALPLSAPVAETSPSREDAREPWADPSGYPPNTRNGSSDLAPQVRR